jgi:hypothetical protein
MNMKQIDEVAQTACENPDDRSARLALSDLLRADEDIELADAVQGSTGPALLRAVVEFSVRVQLPISARLLWVVYSVLPRQMSAPARMLPPAAAPIATPNPFYAPPVYAPGYSEIVRPVDYRPWAQVPCSDAAPWVPDADDAAANTSKAIREKWNRVAQTLVTCMD